MNQSQSIKIRRFREADFPAWQKLFYKTFKKNISREYFDWKYNKRPEDSGKAICWCAFDEGGDLVGARSAFPAVMKFGPTSYQALQFGDSMVDADHRGKGIFRKINELALEEVSNEGYAFVFNFPNPVSYPAYRKMGWQSIAEITKKAKLLSPGKYLANTVLKTCRLPESIRIQAYPKESVLAKWKPKAFRHTEIDRFGEVHESLFESSAGDHAHRYRNAAYLNWRYKHSAGSDFKCYEIFHGQKIAGVIVMHILKKRHESTGILMETCGSSEMSRSKLLQYAQYLAGLNQCSTIRTWSFNTEELNLLKRHRFITRNESLYFVIKKLQTNIPDRIMEQESWLMTAGDNDAI